MSTLSAETPGLADVNSDTELGHFNPALEEKRDVMAALQLRSLLWPPPIHEVTSFSAVSTKLPRYLRLLTTYKCSLQRVSASKGSCKS